MKSSYFKNNCLYTGILALQFLVCGTVYISQAYLLLNYYPAEKVTSTIAMSWNYLAQALGMLTFIFLFLKVPKLAGNRISYAIFIAIGTIITAISLHSEHVIIILTFTIIYNFLIGLSSGFNITLLTKHIPKNMLGLAFGAAYAIGSVGTYIISVIGNGNFLKSKYVIIVYMFINIIRIFILYFSQSITCTVQDRPKVKSKYVMRNFSENISIYLLIVLMIISVNIIMYLGNTYQFAEINNGKANLPLSRAFYAVSLTFAGLLSVRSRKHLALATFASLLFPIVTIPLSGDSAFASVLLTVTYLFLGFTAVFRSLSIMDIAAGDNKLLAFACAGLMMSRVVEAVTTMFNHIIVTNRLLISIIFSVLYAILLLLFFSYIQKTHQYAVSNEPEVDDKLVRIVQKYGLTPREKDVLAMLIKGNSNNEITQVMFISENTVKFHIKNLLKKTNCSNRADLISLYNAMKNYSILS
jgi:DNA-binding CsgD family transcriptional regulator/MFS family permease